MIETHSTGREATARATINGAVYQHGWHSWCDTRWLESGRSRTIVTDQRERLGHDHPSHGTDTTPGGSGCGAVDGGDGTITLLGALAPGAWVTVVDGHLRGQYEEYDQAASGPWVTLTGVEHEVFTRYAELLADHLGRRGGERIRLWCSWYSLYQDISESTLVEVVDGLADFAFDVVQVDDGWQRAIGDWHPNDRFRSGMAALADHIRSTGRRAGLWLAPFIARADSEFAHSRRELILHDQQGDPVVAGVNWGGPYFALDLSREQTLDHVTAVMDQYRSAGYDFFKLDFIYAGAIPGAHAASMSRTEAYRRACERIRQAVGDEAYLLACGAPIIDSIGVFDGIRIGPDVGPVWDDGSYAAVRRALATSVHRTWLSPAIDTDPDVAYFEEPQLSPGAKRLLQQLAHITGFRGTSELPHRLGPEPAAALATFLNTEPEVVRQGRYRWTVGGEEADFGPILEAGAAQPQWERAG